MALNGLRDGAAKKAEFEALATANLLLTIVDKKSTSIDGAVSNNCITDSCTDETTLNVVIATVIDSIDVTNGGDNLVEAQCQLYLATVIFACLPLAGFNAGATNTALEAVVDELIANWVDA